MAPDMVDRGLAILSWAGSIWSGNINMCQLRRSEEIIVPVRCACHGQAANAIAFDLRAGGLGFTALITYTMYRLYTDAECHEGLESFLHAFLPDQSLTL